MRKPKMLILLPTTPKEYVINLGRAAHWMLYFAKGGR